MKYLVTGGFGFIGSHITEYLINRGDSVIVIDNLNTGKTKNLESVIDKIKFFKGDILDSELLEKITKDVDGVFHQAALASVQESFAKPEEYHNVNVNGTENILKLAKQFGFKVVYASSSSVYGNPKNIPIKESDERNPINPYAETKLKDEELAVSYSKLGVNVIGLRYFNVFGNRQSKEYAGVIKLFLERIRDKLPPKINGDGEQFRDFIHVSDVVKANIMAMESDVNHAFFNVGTNSSISILELAKTVIQASGLNIEPIYGPPLPGDVQKTLADIQLIKEKISWTPTIKLEDWIKRVITSDMIDEV
jgi:UDP-glucose 4-epimerase